MQLEKNARLNHDAVSLGKILVCFVEICYEQKAWNDLNDQITALTKVQGGDFNTGSLGLFNTGIFKNQLYFLTY